MNPPIKETQEAIFAGGCFWCSEADFEKLPGIIEVISGYTGGETENPSYKEVTTGRTGHFEAVKVIYNPSVIAYEKLLEYYWRGVDPTDAGGQFFDRGTQYKTAIFYFDAEQKTNAEKSKQALADSKRFGDSPIVTEILEAEPFYQAEEYHQGYYKKSPAHYQRYRTSSGRDRFINKVWGK